MKTTLFATILAACSSSGGNTSPENSGTEIREAAREPQADKAVATLRPDAGAVTVRDSDVAAPDTPCIEPPKRSFVIEATYREAHPQREAEERAPTVFPYATEPMLDLDGDGQLDVAVPRATAPGACPHQVELDLYLMRGACGHHVGTVTGTPALLGDRRAGHLATLETDNRYAEITDPKRPPGPENVATLHEVRTRYVEEGGRYVASALVDSGGLCHHCGIPSCRRRKP